MQARWGTHGDHPIIVLTPASVMEIYEQTIRAFNLAEALRTPVVVLYDETVGHLMETVEVPDPATLKLVERKWANGTGETFLPFKRTDDHVPVMARPGDGNRCHMTGLTHGENGFPTQNPAEVTRMMRHLLGKLDHHRDLVTAYQALECDDAEVLVVAFGISARAAQRAVKTARRNGIKAGLFRPITLWPFPEEAFLEIASKARAIIVAEMNAGQLSLEIERLCGGKDKIERINRIDGEPIEPREVLGKIEDVARK